VWTWIAIDADTKLVPSWYIGRRTTTDARRERQDPKRPDQGGSRQFMARGHGTACQVPSSDPST